jgi:hypothetical protein
MKSAFTDLEAEIHSIWSRLEAEGHKEAERVHALYEHLHALLPGVESEVKADAEQVAKDAVDAEKPVANEAVQDVASVGETAVTGSATEPVKP